MALSMIDPRQMTDEQRNLVLGKILPDSVPPTQPANAAPQPGPLTPVEPAKPKEGALSPVDQRMQHDTQKLQDLQNYKHLGEQGSTHPGTLGKVGHVFSTIGNTLGNIFAPGVMEMTPGTTAHRYAQIGQLKNDIAGEQQQKLEGAEAEHAQAEADTERNKPPDAMKMAESDAYKENVGKGVVGMDNLKALRGKAEGKPEYLKTDQGYFSVDADGKLTPLTYNGEPLRGDRSQVAPPHITALGKDGKMHVMERDPASGEYNIDRGVTKIPGAGDGHKEETRSDNSYKYNNDQLDKIGAPAELLAQRLGRLQDTLNEHNPQSDALVAPELLTVMAGGQGSGLRMNEAEISRIVGGRSAWENLKASVQHWASDPASARSITPDQDRQIRALVGVVGQKLQRKRELIDQAHNQLLGTDDPKEHRRIVVETRQAMTSVDAGAEGDGAPPPGTVEDGFRFKGGDPKNPNNWERVGK